MMKKQTWTIWLLLLGTFILLFIATLFLPNKIPFHFDAKGEAGWYKQVFYSFIYASALSHLLAIYP